MSQVTTKLNILGNNKNYNFQSTSGYTQVIDVEQDVDSTDGFIEVINFSSTKGTSTIPSAKSLCVYNQSSVAIEVQLKTAGWKDGGSNSDTTNSVDVSGDGASVNRYVSMIIPAGDFIYLDNSRIINYATDESAGNATTLSNVVPNANMYTDSTADTDDTTATDNVDNSATNTTVYLEPYTSATNCTANLFKVGDLIRIRDEIMEVTAIGDKSDLANNTLTVKRGMFGSTATSNTDDDDAVRFAFFNMYSRFDKFSTARTDETGKFRCKNFFGYARNLTGSADGIVRGSFAMKFYEKAYQELGLSGITLNSETGLTAGTTYQFTIAIDGGSAYDVDLTIDSSNTKFGGNNGFIAKLNSLFQQQYYTAGNLFEKDVRVSLVNGDIRFTSGSHLSTSAVVLGDSSGGDTDLWGAGRIPALASIEGSVASKLPDDTVIDKETGVETPNTSAFAFDDGKTNILGVATGTISYETGELNFSGPPNAEFVVSASYESAHSGGVSTSSNKNNLQSISARSLNSKVNAKIKVLGFN